ncbi:MAG: SusC/RagA family TonB-linked outer membrane protein [Pseudoflavonifractor sp.]|nr:SusC/RagA family TonB-linked outer membrane protein [Alloprevotella sp.]MCM1116978.1 SusC/RagA family TonB-linked outer membrane protein [Pseudoflavonifractor sp.]
MKKLFLFMLTVIISALSVAAQNRTVTGTVVYASDGEPLIGATVTPVGGGNATATNFEGKFSLVVPNSVTHIQVSYVGMITRNVAISDKPLHIELTNHDNELEEVMVVAYGTAKKSAYTGSASVVKADAIENALVSTVTDALSGKVAGVQLQSSNGQPGTSPKVYIRGVGSINAGTAPLYVVDGIPYDGDISNINSMDVESMTVLKDAAAAALYGARGANGVILITTKQGQAGATKVTVDMRWGGNSRAIPKYDVLESSEQYFEQMYRSIYNSAYFNQTMTAAGAHSYANSEIFKRLGYQTYTVPTGEGLINADGRFNPNATRGYVNGNYYYTPDDWSKEMLRNGLRQEYNVAISGGSDRYNFYVSGAYLNDEGIIDGSHFNRFSARTAFDYKVNKWLKVGTNMNYTYTNSGYPGEQTASASSGNAFMMGNDIAPVYPVFVRNADGSIKTDPSSGKPIYDYGDGKSTPYTRNFMSMSNPKSDLLYNTTEYLADIFNGKWYAQINPIEGLNITGTASYFTDNTRFHELGNPLYGQSASYGGTAVQEYIHSQALNLQALAAYRRTFAEKHDMDILLGYESYEWKYEDGYAQGQNLYRPNSWVVSNTIDNRNGGGSTNEYSTRGIFARVNYSFDQRYFFSASYRRDASSRFHPDHRWGNFFSVSGAWDIAKETFMNDVNWVDQLKFKASFGQQGNDAIGNYYPYLDQYQVTGGNGVWSDGTLYYKGNPEITWETSNNLNIGFDFSLNKGMVSGTIEYFSRQVSDMLYKKPVAPSNGYTSIPMNIGSMRNNGWEIELNYRPVATRNITWDINANITFINNKILKLHPDLNGEFINGTTYYCEGESQFQLYLAKYAGVDPTTGLALYWAKDDDGNEYATTDYSEANNYNRAPTGNLMPKAYGGFGTTFQAYGFDLSLSFAYQFGGKAWDYSYQKFMHADDWGRNWHKDILNAWTPQNTNTNVPRLDALDQYSGSTSDRWLTNSNYLSLNNITLGYTLPNKLTRQLHLQQLRIYGSAENVALWTARKGFDPRQSYTDTDGATYSGIRCISGGIRVSF